MQRRVKCGVVIEKEQITKRQGLFSEKGKSVSGKKHLIDRRGKGTN